jgi:hypothetical protein
MEPGSMMYAQQCVAASIELLLGDDFLTGLTKEDKALTFQEFIAENDGATKKQYLTYIKNRLTSKMDQAPDEVVEEPTEEVNEIVPQAETLAWERETIYAAGDRIFFGNMEYVATTATTGFPGVEGSGWELAPGQIGPEPAPAIADNIPEWDNAERYREGDLVRHNERVYRARRNTGLRPTNRAAWLPIVEPTPMTEAIENIDTRTATQMWAGEL